jgi:tetratricopeptide (TPR) repeat protein
MRAMRPNTSRSLMLSLAAFLAACSSGPSAQEVEAAKQAAALKAKQDAINKENGLIGQYQTAQAAQNWPEAEKVLVSLTEMSPRWQYYIALGDARVSQEKLPEAVDAYEQGVPLLEQALSDPATKPADLPKMKTTLGQVLTNEGNIYAKLNKSDKAVEAFTKGAPYAAEPYVAFFNVCVMHYNAKHFDQAIEACTSASTADPTKPDAYYLRGSALFTKGKMVKNKYNVPEGTVDALQKYLELAPTGPHAKEVAQMLSAAGVKPKK